MNEVLFLVYPESAEAGAIETLPKTQGMTILREDEFLHLEEELVNSNKVCITSEAILERVLARWSDQRRIDAILAMKDKYLFRQLIGDLFPHINYRHLNFEEIETLEITSKKVLKPMKGCFGTAVKILDQNSDLTTISTEIKDEIKKNSTVLSESVLSQSEFILEDYVEGEEYAVDLFFDSKGEAHIVNVYYHPIPVHSEYLHMIYMTNQEVFTKVYDKAMTFFSELNKKLRLTNIALHSEFKLSDELIPIEINAMRFGGMGLGNMIYHSLGVNAYEHFILEKTPDWDQIWTDNTKSNFVYFIAYNGSKIDKNEKSPDFDKLERRFTRILNKTKFDYKTQLAFAVYTLEESKENIGNLLTIDFNDYFSDKDDSTNR